MASEFAIWIWQNARVIILIDINKFFLVVRTRSTSSQKVLANEHETQVLADHKFVFTIAR